MSLSRVVVAVLACIQPWIITAALAQSSNGFGARARIQTPRLAETRGRAGSTVTRAQMQERLPRSAPEALRFEPGVYIQQTAHGQASAFIRGLTGQQVLLLFDGIRLNNGIYRQGPNQYFFTVDSQTIERIDVIRGSASTRYGADALGGAVLTTPLHPLNDTTPRYTHGDAGYTLRPAINIRYGSADNQWGGRIQLDGFVKHLANGHTLRFLGGVGYREAGLLRSGGPVFGISERSLPAVPRFAEDGKTQLGTGFDEGTFDARLVYTPNDKLTITGATYGYRQSDAPRTDQCPPPGASIGSCLRVKKQFRTLSYAKIEGSDLGLIDKFRASFSFQSSHESRLLDQPASLSQQSGDDTIDTWGLRSTALHL